MSRTSLYTRCCSLYATATICSLRFISAVLEVEGRNPRQVFAVLTGRTSTDDVVIHRIAFARRSSGNQWAIIVPCRLQLGVQRRDCRQTCQSICLFAARDCAQYALVPGQTLARYAATQHGLWPMELKDYQEPVSSSPSGGKDGESCSPISRRR